MKKLVLIIVLVVVIGIGATGFYLASKPDGLSQKEKDQAYSKILGRDANLNPDIKTGSTKYQGKFISFLYPSQAKVYNYVDPGSKKNTYVKERFSFDMKSPKLVLNYTAEDDQDSVNKITDYPAVKMREDKSFGYKEFTLDSDGVKGLGFSRQRSGEADAEKSIFFLKDGMIYSISISGSNLDDVSDLFEKVAGSFEFQ